MAGGAGRTEQRQGGVYELTPLYDVLSAYPVIGTGANTISSHKVKMAMAVRSKTTHYKMQDILRRHWVAVGESHGVITPDGRHAAFVIDDLIARIPEVVRTVRALLPANFPEPLADSILTGVQNAANELAH